MTAAALLAGLKKRGVEFNVDRDRLRWKAPAGVMTDETSRPCVAIKPR